jgi:hypothetical protein
LTVLKHISNLTQPPEGVDLFIFDLPMYYAAGDRDILYVNRGVTAETANGHVGEYEQQLADFIKANEMVQVDYDSAENPDPNSCLRGVVEIVLVSPHTNLTEEQATARLRELVAPLLRMGPRADRAWAKSMLEE